MMVEHYEFPFQLNGIRVGGYIHHGYERFEKFDEEKSEEKRKEIKKNHNKNKHSALFMFTRSMKRCVACAIEHITTHNDQTYCHMQYCMEFGSALRLRAPIFFLS